MLLFVYGTLTDPARASEVLGRDPSYLADAVLDGLGRVDGDYPTLVPGGACEGRLLRVDRPDLHRLDAYEGVADGLYVRVSVPFDAGGAGSGDEPATRVGTVEAYVGDPGRLDAPGSWPGDGSLADRVREYVAEAGVVVRSGG
jgi:gamma-glutamylaminecyclotransferase